jgi:hypothetical protein
MLTGKALKVVSPNEFHGSAAKLSVCFPYGEAEESSQDGNIIHYTCEPYCAMETQRLR